MTWIGGLGGLAVRHLKGPLVSSGLASGLKPRNVLISIFNVTAMGAPVNSIAGLTLLSQNES